MNFFLLALVISIGGDGAAAKGVAEVIKGKLAAANTTTSEENMDPCDHLPKLFKTALRKVCKVVVGEVVIDAKAGCLGLDAEVAAAIIVVCGFDPLCALALVAVGDTIIEEACTLALTVVGNFTKAACDSLCVDETHSPTPWHVPCALCIEDYVDCTDACWHSGYDSGTCAHPESTDKQKCCECTSASPTGSPSSSPTGSPTSSPTGSPTGSPTSSPTGAPTAHCPLFVVDNMARNYTEGQQFCGDIGGSVASVRSQEENDEVFGLLEMPCYLGAEYNVNAGNPGWKWEDSSSWWNPKEDAMWDDGKDDVTSRIVYSNEPFGAGWHGVSADVLGPDQNHPIGVVCRRIGDDDMECPDSWRTCVKEGGDPWATDKELACCPGLLKKLGHWSEDRADYFLCVSATTTTNNE